MQSKSDQIRQALNAGDDLQALRIASRFHDRSPETKQYKQAYEAIGNAAFYKQLGKDPQSLYNNAIKALRGRFLDGKASEG